MNKWKDRLRKAAQWLSEHRREMIGVVSIFVIIGVVHPVHAAGVDTISQIALWIATLFAWIAQHVVKMIVIIIDLVVVPIMRYNNFVSSPVVGQGWSVVRDLVNMFFVVILLLIAFQTIFGVGRADWKRQVPRLLIMAIVINFSRTIAGILIDFGQVVMFTFVNAIKDVAGGNFIQLFGLDALFDYSKDAISRSTSNDTGFQAFDFFGAAFLTMALTFVILATMIILAALLAFRIVILWCLIIVAPLTFFLGGAKGVIGGAEGYYADWWKRFTAAVSLGPILTFFVWLSLAAASSGNLAEKQGFEVQTENDEAAGIGGEITKAFDAPHMTSLIIAVALLFAGFEVSQQTAGSLGGRAGSMAASGIKGIPGLAKSLAKVGVPAAMGYGALTTGTGAAIALTAGGTALAANKQWSRAGGKGATETGKFGSLLDIGTTAWREDVMSKVGGGLRDFGGMAARSNVPILTGMGRRVQNMGFKTLQAQNTHKEHEWEEASKANGAMGFDNMRELASMKITTTMTEEQKMRIEHAKLAILNNKNRAGEVTAKDIQEGGHAWGDISGDLPDKELDKAGSNALVRFPVLLAKKHNADGTPLSRADKKKRMAEQLGFMANSADKLREIRRQNFEDPEDGELFIEVAKETKGRATNDKSVFEHLQDGKADQSVKEWFTDNDTKLVNQSRTSVTNAANTFVPAMNAARTSGDAAAVAAAVSSLTAAIKGLTVNDVAKGALTPEVMAKPGFAKVFGQTATPEMLDAMSVPLRGAFFDALQGEDQSIKANPRLTPQQQNTAQAEVEIARTRARQGPGEYDTATGKFVGPDPENRKAVVNEAVRSDPKILEQLTESLGNFKNDLAESIAEGIKMTKSDGTSDHGEAVMNKLFEELGKTRTHADFGPAGSVGDEVFRRSQETVTTAINHLTKILKETNGVTGRNSDALALLAKKRQRGGIK